MTLLPPADMAQDQVASSSLTATTMNFNTGSFTIPPGDTFECFYTDMITDKDYSVVSAFGKQGPGGHHITVYYKTGPAQPAGHHPCSEEEMLNWRMVAGANDVNVQNVGGEPAIQLPPGLGTKLPVGHQMVLQIHYINATQNTYNVNDQVTVNFGDAATVKAYANYVVINDAGFALPAQQVTEHVTTCVMQQDYNIVLMLGHMHDHGQHFTLERIDDKGNQLEMLYDHAWTPSFASHPPLVLNTMEKPLLIPKGTRFRQTCRWDNKTTNEVRFPTEMCVSFMYYFPDAGDQSCQLQ